MLPIQWHDKQAKNHPRTSTPWIPERERGREREWEREREGKLLLMPTSVFPSSYFILAALFPVAVLHIYPVSDTFFVPMFAVCMSLFIQCPSRSTSNSPPAQQHVMLPSSSYEIQSNNCIHVYCLTLPPFSSLATSSVKNVEIDFLFCCFAVNFPFFTQLCHWLSVAATRDWVLSLVLSLQLLAATLNVSTQGIPCPSSLLFPSLSLLPARACANFWFSREHSPNSEMSCQRLNQRVCCIWGVPVPLVLAPCCFWLPLR